MSLFVAALFVYLIVGALVIGATVLWVWMLVDCLNNEPSEGNDKVVWVLVIILTHVLGAWLYLYFRRPQRIKEFGR